MIIPEKLILTEDTIKLIDEQATNENGAIAKAVYAEAYDLNRQRGASQEWSTFRALSTVFLYGYIQGVQMERKKRGGGHD